MLGVTGAESDGGGGTTGGGGGGGNDKPSNESSEKSSQSLLRFVSILLFQPRLLLFIVIGWHTLFDGLIDVDGASSSRMGGGGGGCGGIVGIFANGKYWRRCECCFCWTADSVDGGGNIVDFCIDDDILWFVIMLNLIAGSIDNGGGGGGYGELLTRLSLQLKSVSLTLIRHTSRWRSIEPASVRGGTLFVGDARPG